ncbi:MAG: ARPP-1 family domain-containing protein [Candidatus Humimicrobiaceae bacterium]
MFSLDTAYEKIHSKLIKSYAVSAIRPLKNAAKRPDMQTAFDFLNEAKKSNQTRFKSKGLGHDIRFEGLNRVGSSLCLEEEIIHMAFFIIAREEDGPGYMDGYHKRMKTGFDIALYYINNNIINKLY